MDKRHGGPWDRGAADSWYERGFHPHYFEGASYQSPRVERAAMTPEQIEEYRAGFAFNEEHGGHKEWE